MGTANVASTQLRGEPASARAARRFVRDVIRAWGCDDVVDEVVLLTDELVTNVILHARTDIEQHARIERGVVRVEVRDGSPQQPVPRDAADADTGRGLAMVDALSAAWGVDEGPSEKTVWFEVPSTPYSEVGDTSTINRAPRS